MILVSNIFFISSQMLHLRVTQSVEIKVIYDSCDLKRKKICVFAADISFENAHDTNTVRVC